MVVGMLVGADSIDDLALLRQGAWTDSSTNAGGAKLCYPDGSGSASTTRALEAGLMELVG